MICQIVHGLLDASRVVFEQTKRLVARTTEEAANLTSIVIVVSVQSTVRGLIANRTTTTLLFIQLVVPLLREAVLAAQFVVAISLQDLLPISLVVVSAAFAIGYFEPFRISSL